MIIISKATDDDVSILQYIDYICFYEKETEEYNDKLFNYLMINGLTYVAYDTDSNKIVGYITTIIKKNNEFYPEVVSLLKNVIVDSIIELSSIAVLPEYRGKKISRMLLDTIDNGELMYLHVKKSNEIAQKVYEKNNWTHCEIVVDCYGAGKDGLLMCKNFDKI